MFIDYLEQVLGTPKWNTSNSEASWCCPFCTSRGETEDTRFRFRFNERKMVGVCYNCDWGGSAIKFVADFNRVNWAEAFDIVNFYGDYRPLPADVYDEVFDKLMLDGLEYESKGKYIPKPSDFRLLTNCTSPLANRFIKYAKSRKLTNTQIEKHGLGFCLEGEVILPNGKKTYLNNHLIVQTFDDEYKPIYWMGRAILKEIQPKAFNPVGGVGTLNKSDVIFNLNNAKKTGVAVLCEGVFDATTVGDSGVAIFGSSLSVKQLIKLIQADLEAVYVMLDPDVLTKALKTADLINKHIPTYFCKLKDGCDPNDLGRKGCLEAIRDAERYSALTALKYKLLN